MITSFQLTVAFVCIMAGLIVTGIYIVFEIRTQFKELRKERTHETD